MLCDIAENIPDRSDAAIQDYLVRILNREVGDRSGKIFGLGHAVYTISDPRTVIIKRYARKMADARGFAADFELIEAVERLGIPLVMERIGRDIPMCANVDLYSGLIYHMLGIPDELFTPLFAIARIAGWCAHRLEEVATGGKIIRPAYRSSMQYSHYVPLEERG